MSLPRHAINRLAALHLVLGLMDASEAPITDSGFTAEERAKSAQLCRRICAYVARAQAMEPSDPDNPRLVNTVIRGNEVIWKSWDMEVDAREAVSMALARVSKEAEAIPRAPKWLDKRLEWAELESLLQMLLECLDPDLEAVEQIEKGDQVAARMAAASSLDECPFL